MTKTRLEVHLAIWQTMPLRGYIRIRIQVDHTMYYKLKLYLFLNPFNSYTIEKIHQLYMLMHVTLAHSIGFQDRMCRAGLLPNNADVFKVKMESKLVSVCLTFFQYSGTCLFQTQRTQQMNTTWPCFLPSGGINKTWPLVFGWLKSRNTENCFELYRGSMNCHVP